MIRQASDFKKEFLSESYLKYLKEFEEAITNEPIISSSLIESINNRPHYIPSTNPFFKGYIISNVQDMLNTNSANTNSANTNSANTNSANTNTDSANSIPLKKKKINKTLYEIMISDLPFRTIKDCQKRYANTNSRTIKKEDLQKFMQKYDKYFPNKVFKNATKEQLCDHLFNEIECEEKQFALENKNNSCYIDSILVAFFHQKNEHISKQ